MSTETESVTVVKHGLDSPTLTCVLTEICINLCLLSANTTTLENALQHRGTSEGADTSEMELQNSTQLQYVQGTHPTWCTMSIPDQQGLDVKPQQQQHIWQTLCKICCCCSAGWERKLWWDCGFCWLLISFDKLRSPCSPWHFFTPTPDLPPNFLLLHLFPY